MLTGNAVSRIFGNGRGHVKASPSVGDSSKNYPNVSDGRSRNGYASGADLSTKAQNKTLDSNVIIIIVR